MIRNARYQSPVWQRVANHFTLNNGPSVERFAFSSTFLITLGIYLSVLSLALPEQHISGDSGELITASYTLGVPHPPGYPTFVILGKVFSLIPLGSVALRYRLFSAISMAFAASLISSIAYAQISRVEGNKKFQANHAFKSVLLGLLVGASPLAIRLGTSIEVYALNLMVVAAFLWSLIGNKNPVIQGVFFGLSITTHLTSLILLPIWISFSRRGKLLPIIAGFAIGLLPFLAIPVLSVSESPIRWGQANTFPGWLWLITGKLYQGNLQNYYSAMSLTKIIDWSPFLILLLVHLVSLGIDHRVGNKQERSASPLQITSILVSIILMVVFSITYQTIDSANYLLPVLVLLATLITVATNKISKVTFAIFLVVAASTFFLLPSPEASNTPQLKTLLQIAPEKSILVTPGDSTIGTIWYLKHIENIRPDVQLIDDNMFQFAWYRRQIAVSNNNLRNLEVDDLTRFIQANSDFQPVCYLQTQPDLSLLCLGE